LGRADLRSSAVSTKKNQTVCAGAPYSDPIPVSSQPALQDS
jgi:hypothetical protein